MKRFSPDCVVARIFYLIFHRAGRRYINEQLTAHLARARHEEATERASERVSRMHGHAARPRENPRRRSSSARFRFTAIESESRRFRQNRRYLSAKSVVGGARSRTEGQSSSSFGTMPTAPSRRSLSPFGRVEFSSERSSERLFPPFVFGGTVCTQGVQ